MEQTNKYIKQDRKITLELYRNDNGFGIWLSDDCGGSGIEVTGNTPEDAANKIKPYIADYFYEQN